MKLLKCQGIRLKLIIYQEILAAPHQGTANIMNDSGDLAALFAVNSTSLTGEVSLYRMLGFTLVNVYDVSAP